MLNPQYLVRIPTTARGKVDLSLTVETEKDLPVNVLLAWSKGERIFEYVLTLDECRLHC